MTAPFATLDGHRLTAVRLTIGNTGPWHAEVDFEGEPEVSGRVTMKLGALELVGTLVAEQSGTFGLQRKARLVAGGGGWASELGRKAYHNDAQVKAQTVAADAARECGETLGTFVPSAERIGVDFVRDVGPASRVLERVIGGAPWWVDYAGVTQVGPRAAVSATTGTYEVLAYEPRDRLATLAVDDLTTVGIGSILTDRLDAPQTVRELEVVVTADEVRVMVWCGGSEAGPGNLAGLLTAIARKATDGPLFGKYRYRVVRMSADRVECQAVRAGAGLPDVLPVSMWAGVAGAHAELTPGAEVLLEFIEGDRTMPILAGFAGKDGVGHVPVSLTLCGSTQAAARQGDLVQSGGVGTVVTLTPVATLLPGPLAPCVGIGLPYLISFDAVPPTPILAAPLYGAISTGSPKVRA
jgi:hypothetical protein